ncbi:phenylalanine-tRNA ligase [Rhinocladiella mackenziei CBS 650.93]|uniref:Phenylalanine--tRNA ligase, mitochondrial n=1 Tax=Rhinocladiella mackenziei CBS 650.93 TaxID=1442369 RepID=A0A0D2H0U2_9EURO|nr:phenylalanine-tRNA ligase [Rhinocladiella mackenziei CBS 650.93]KIX04043.1 phenylalanine-tRNA ligase [Rhinocladiella mackenziei CBS 650.93]
MQLLRTGAFVRAARFARTSLPIHRAATPAIFVPSRWSSSQAAAEQQHPFPEQSVKGSREVDPSKTATVESKSDGGRLNIKQKPQESDQDNTIIQGYQSGAKILGIPYIFDKTSNVSNSILNLVGRNLYDEPDHPLCITRKLIESCFPSPEFHHFTVKSPVVTIHENFDVLGFPADHPGRSRTDTYYINSNHLLRTHTSAHQHTAFQSLANENTTTGYTICADVYRRDSIDKSHFPVFHQMEGAKIWPLPNDLPRFEAQKVRASRICQDMVPLPAHQLRVYDEAKDFVGERNPIQLEHDLTEVNHVARHLKQSLEILVDEIFRASQQSLALGTKMGGPGEVRWVEAYFPFTSPSFELEVLWKGEWLEVLGCGIVQQPILNKAGLKNSIGWAWGLGVERFAMLLFDIPDIRLFWSRDPRFLKQFCRGKITKFEPFSKYPACYKDMAFWINPAPAAASPVWTESSSGAAAAAGGDSRKASPTEAQTAAFHENDIMEVVRDVAGSLAEDVKLVDEFVHPTSGRKSLCYRINYRSLERTLTNEEVNKMHEEVAARMVSQFGVEMR